MCLELKITVPEDERSQLERAIASSPPGTLRIDIEHPKRWRWARNTVVRAYVSEQGGCACSLLSDDADWNATAWSMRDEVLDPLKRTLMWLASELPNGFTVEVLWQGDAVQQEVHLTADEIGDMAATGRLGTHVRYVVTRSEAA
jgi:hypothetical protein